MRRVDSRITLEITGLRVERLQEITEEDAWAEGFPLYLGEDMKSKIIKFSIDCFREYWDSLNAKRGFSWSENPWVWVIEFRRANSE